MRSVQTVSDIFAMQGTPVDIMMQLAHTSSASDGRQLGMRDTWQE